MIHPLEKPKRVVDPAYLDFIRSMPCYVCGADAEPHHVATRGSGGSDYTALPLCRKHHGEVDLGRVLFEATYLLSLWRGVAKYNEIYIRRLVKHVQGLGAVLPITEITPKW